MALGMSPFLFLCVLFCTVVLNTQGNFNVNLDKIDVMRKTEQRVTSYFPVLAMRYNELMRLPDADQLN